MARVTHLVWGAVQRLLKQLPDSQGGRASKSEGAPKMRQPVRRAAPGSSLTATESANPPATERSGHSTTPTQPPLAPVAPAAPTPTPAHRPTPPAVPAAGHPPGGGPRHPARKANPPFTTGARQIPAS